MHQIDLSGKDGAVSPRGARRHGCLGARGRERSNRLRPSRPDVRVEDVVIDLRRCGGGSTPGASTFHKPGNRE